MKNNTIIYLAAVLLMLLPGDSKAQFGKAGSFIAGNNEFLLNGKPFVIRAAELHYPRIPKPYWEQRIQMCKAMGMNTICIYLFWNLHEQQQGYFDFSGQQDVAAFVELIQKNGMYCIIRPGPYVCAEWDMGGLPWWLLKNKNLQVRTIKDTFFMQSARRYLNKVGEKLSLFQIQKGGNVIMVQVENEYGVWGNDAVYMAAIRDNIRSAGFDTVQLFRCDWSSNFDKYKLPGVAGTLNFGAGSNIDQQFKKFKEVNPGAPLMCSEYWTGWFDQWGRPHETRGINTFIGSLKDMMDRKISFSLYMSHGGTSFGQWAGANAPPYAPTVSSYDYDAPINESGRPTEKFYAIRDLLKNYLQDGEKLGEVPRESASLIEITPIKFSQSANLFDNLPAPKKTEQIQSMEMFGQGWGRIIYRTTLTASPRKKKLMITDVHDWALVLINGKLVGKIDRRLPGNVIEIPAFAARAQLDIVVEATGRVNYGQAILDRKGITEKVELSDGKDTTGVKNWQVYNLPVDYPFQKRVTFKNIPLKGPGWYKGTFHLNKTGDTYLDVSKCGKGMVWVNGFNLGRVWKIGPTQSMYLPGCWLQKGMNEIIVFDLEGQGFLSIAGLPAPIYKIAADSTLLHRKTGQQLDLSNEKPVMQGSLEPAGGWKEILLPALQDGRYFCFEALNAQQHEDPSTSIAEFEILLENGNVASSINWKVVYADSEEVTASNSSADKIFDLQESVIWQTAATTPRTGHPHSVVIDMGENMKVKGFRILPRGDRSKAGIVKDYRFYLSTAPFKVVLKK